MLLRRGVRQALARARAGCSGRKCPTQRGPPPHRQVHARSCHPPPAARPTAQHVQQCTATVVQPGARARALAMPLHAGSYSRCGTVLSRPYARASPLPKLSYNWNNSSKVCALDCTLRLLGAWAGGKMDQHAAPASAHLPAHLPLYDAASAQRSHTAGPAAAASRRCGPRPLLAAAARAAAAARRRARHRVARDRQ